jgi:serine kinase of HPr protein (carbohydrate metabolism regulator)
MIVHAGLIALRLGGGWRGVLIQGPSGSGKSDLALRAIGQGFRLVADDRTVLFLSAGRLFGRAPGPLHGLIEVRGVGVIRTAILDLAPIVLSVQCKTTPDAVERHPEATFIDVLGAAVPAMDLWPFENSAPAKIGRAIEHLGARP